jgi:ABC-type branched-subunit amino acid transport system substrate-binding protein
MRARAWLAALALLGCPKSSSSTADEPDSITLGSLTALTGDLSSQGRDFADVTTIVVDEINSQGGILGKKMRIELQDDGTTAAGAKVGFSNLITKNVPLVLGPSTSGETVEIVDLIKSSHILTIAATPTSPAISTLDDDDFLFRLAPSDVHQAQVLVEQLIQKVDPPAIKKMCIVFRNDSYGTNFTQIVKDKMTALGVQVTTSGYQPEALDLSHVIEPCDHDLRCGGTGGDAGADAGGPSCTIGDEREIAVLFVTFVADGASVLDSAYKTGWSADKQRFFFPDGARDQALIQLVANPQMLEGSVGTAPSGPDTDTQDGELRRNLLAKFRARFNRDGNLFLENIYDAAYLGAAAIELAGTATNSALIRDALRKLHDPAGVQVATGEWSKIKDLIAQKQPMKLVGASGSLQFDANGDTLPPYYYSLWAVKNGVIVNTSVQTIR